jgi:hypothetical protein
MINIWDVGIDNFRFNYLYGIHTMSTNITEDIIEHLESVVYNHSYLI